VQLKNECGLYREPELYDLLFPDAASAAQYIDDEMRKERLLASQRFYVEEARTGGGRVLELACGSGRMTIPIAQAGIEIVGMDLSASMLEAARSKASAAGVDVTFMQGDMRSFELPQKFSTIFIAGNSRCTCSALGTCSTALRASVVTLPRVGGSCSM